MSTHALISWTRPQRDCIRRALARALEAWAHEWMLRDRSGAPGPAVGDVIAADDGPKPVAVAQWKRLAHRGDAILWMSGGDSSDDALDRSIVQLLFGHAPRPGHPPALATRLAARARADLLHSVATAAGLEVLGDLRVDTSAGERLRRWRGAVRTELTIAGCTITLLMNAACAKTLAGDLDRPAKPRPAPAPLVPLVPLRDALAASTVRVRAELHPMQIELGALLGMASGDVIRLTHRLQDPLVLSTDAQTNFCAGHLVRLDGRLAVEFARPESGAPHG
jgi:flagellar motor switch/type III secretory pathway protein FliN